MAVIKQITNVPEVIPGSRRIQEHIQRAPEFYRSDEFAFGEASGAALQLIELPGNCVIVNAWVNVSTAFDASGTSAAATAVLSVPNDTGTLVMWDAANVALQATGSKVATGAMLVPAPTGGFVTVSYTPGSTTVGQFEVYIEVVQFADRLGE